MNGAHSETSTPVCTFHTPTNKVLHKTPYAKDRGRSKDTFGNRLQVPLIQSWRWSLARGRLALLTDETAAGNSPRHCRTRRSLFGNAVM